MHPLEKSGAPNLEGFDKEKLDVAGLLNGSRDGLEYFLNELILHINKYISLIYTVKYTVTTRR